MIRIAFPVVLLLLQAAGAVAQTTMPESAAAVMTEATPLIKRGDLSLTKGDYDAELLRMPAEIRPGFSVNADRVAALVNNLWNMKTLAAAARAQGLDKAKETQVRIALETDRVLATILAEQMEADAIREFDQRKGMDEVARERYTINPAKYRTPEEAVVTQIFFEVPKHTSDDARKLAADARARIVAGADMGALAKQISEDPSTAANGGRLEWFRRDQVDPVFAGAVFSLKNVGDVSEPVRTRGGWHVIRLEDRRGGAQRSFDEAKPEIIAELRNAYVTERKGARLAEYRDDAHTEVNTKAIDQLVVRPSSDAIRKAAETAKP